MKKVIVNDLCMRQVKDSSFSHYEGSWESLEELVEKHLPKGAADIKCMFLVSVPPEGFFSGVVEVTEGMPLYVEFKSRSPGEEPCIQVFAAVDKPPAKYVDIILCRKDELGKDATPGEHIWEILSIHARTTAAFQPPFPITTASNFRVLESIEKGKQSDKQLAAWVMYDKQITESVIYWSKMAMVAPKTS